VPDDAFEQALIDQGRDSGPLDNFVTTSNISSLTSLNVGNKGISSLTGIEDFTALTTLYCYSNSLTSLNVSSNTALTRLDCGNNDLTSLDVSSNIALTFLYCYSNSLTSLDVSSNTALTALYCSSNSLTSLNVSSNTALTFLECGGNNLTSLDVSSNTSLTTLYCYSNSLTSLDVSSNTALTYLECGYNSLPSLDVSSNTALTTLYCNDNDLTSLDVSSNTALITLWCSSNSLTSLNVKNGNNTNFNIFNATINPDLYCIEVDDVTYSDLTWTDIDAGASYSSDCYTSIPDPVFEQALIDQGLDSGAIDGLVTTANISSLTTLDVSNKGISSLTGIEDFTSLTELYCHFNSLTSLDVSSNSALTRLYCYSNSLTSLNVSNNTALTTLFCNSNSLRSLDVSSNTALITLWCSSNSLTSLDVSSNTTLMNLWCDSNSLTSLDMKNGNNTNFNYFDARTNPDLSCIQVDDVAYSTTNWTDIDPGASYNLDCNAVLSIETIEINNFSLYPNPVKDYLNISLNEGLELKRATIYNTLGQFIFSTENLKINTSNIASGIYYIEVETNKGKSAKKILID
jgi:Leucine-rich repeat (LRR) protein